MSVITNKEQLVCCSRHTPDSECIRCSNKLSGYPFLEWIGTDLFLCAPCCLEIKNGSITDIPHHAAQDTRSRRGLLADVIHCAAIGELQALGYGDETLVRVTVAEVEQIARDEDEAMRSTPMEEVEVAQLGK